MLLEWLNFIIVSRLMRKINDRLVYSPSDLINFIESPFASWMDWAMIEGMEGVCPDIEDEERQLVAEEGNRHEENFLVQNTYN